MQSTLEINLPQLWTKPPFSEDLGKFQNVRLRVLYIISAIVQCQTSLKKIGRSFTCNEMNKFSGERNDSAFSLGHEGLLDRFPTVGPFLGSVREQAERIGKLTPPCNLLRSRG